MALAALQLVAIDLLHLVRGQDAPDVEAGDIDAVLAADLAHRLVDQRRVARLPVEDDEAVEPMVEEVDADVLDNRNEGGRAKADAAGKRPVEFRIPKWHGGGDDAVGACRNLRRQSFGKDEIAHRNMRPLCLLRTEGQQHNGFFDEALHDLRRSHVLQTDLAYHHIPFSLSRTVSEALQ